MTLSSCGTWANVLCALAATLFVGAGCFSLDPFLWKEKPVEAYGLDGYAGERECSDAVDSLVKWNVLVDSNVVHDVPFGSEGETIWALLLHDDTTLTPLDTLIFYIYGRTYNIDFYWPRVRLLHATGYPVFVMDYRGYGKSTGEPSEDALYADGRAALNHIRTALSDSTGGPAIVLYGYSTGTLPACELASTDTTGRIVQLILEAPYNSVETVVQDATYLDIPGSYVTTLEGNNAEKIRNVFIPLLWLHGIDDQSLQRETQGLRVWENYPGDTGCFMAVANAGHADVPKKIGYGRYIECIGSFIQGNPTDPLFSCKH